MVIHSDKSPSDKHNCRESGLETPGIAAIFSGAEGGTIEKQDLVIRWSGKLNKSRTERILSLLVTK